MNFTISDRGSSVSNPYLFRKTRSFIAAVLTWFGGKCADWAEAVAPWLRKQNIDE